MRTEKPTFPSEWYDQEYFDKMAAGGFEFFRRQRGRKVTAARMRNLAYLQLRPGMTVLDIGCGRGELVMYSALEIGVTGVGIDYASAGLGQGAKCLEFFSESEHKRILLCCANAIALPVRTHACDRIMSWATLEHLFPWQLELMLSECSRILRPDGIMVLDTHPTNWYERAGYHLNRIARSIAGDNTLPSYKEMKASESGHVNTLSPIKLLHLLRRHGFYSVLRFVPRHQLGIDNKVLRGMAWLLERLPIAKAFFCAEIVTISAKNKRRLREHLATLKRNGDFST